MPTHEHARARTHTHTHMHAHTHTHTYIPTHTSGSNNVGTLVMTFVTCARVDMSMEIAAN